MDKNAATKREVVLVEVALTCLLSMGCWLAPKVIRFQIWHEALTGVVATASLIAAGYRVSLLEKEELMDRVIQAAQVDLFTGEMATEVYLGQLQQQRAIQAMMPTQHQDAKPETPAHPAIQTTSMPSTRLNAPLPNEPEVLDLDEAIHYPSIIVFGAQGSGKTTLAQAIAANKARHGHRIQVLDPHGSDWPFPSVGGGMDYEAVELAVGEFIGEVKQRYHEREQGQKDFAPYTAVCEEFTNWAGRLNKDTSIEFLRTALCDIRKVFMGTIFVVHANTLEGGLAGAKGLAQLRDAGCYQIELFAQIDPVTKRPCPTGRGRLYRPGMPPVDITIPLLQRSDSVQTLNGSPTPLNALEPYPERSVQPIAPTPLNVHEPTVQPPFSWLPLNVQQQLMMAIAQGHPKQKTIMEILGISKGGGEDWKRAISDWDTLKAMMS